MSTDTPPRTFEFPCDTVGCLNTYWAPKNSRRRYCDACIAVRVKAGKALDESLTLIPRHAHNEDNHREVSI